MTDSTNDWLEELLDDLPEGWCPACQHPRCVSNRQSAKQAINQKLIEARIDTARTLRYAVYPHKGAVAIVDNEIASLQAQAHKEKAS